MSFRLASSLAGATLLATSAAVTRADAQATPPQGWQWTLDAPAKLLNGGKFASTDSTFEFALMAPGWHLTMGPGAAVYDPREKADHRYWLTAELILFPDASLQGEYGLFVGAQALDGPAKQWYAFVVRGDGSAAVMHRAGSETHMVMPWTKHLAVKARAAEATVTNVVQLRAEADSTHFLVNGVRVSAFARADLDVNGPFGLRVGKGVNLHITNLDLTRRLAPAPPRR